VAGLQRRGGRTARQSWCGPTRPCCRGTGHWWQIATLSARKRGKASLLPAGGLLRRLGLGSAIWSVPLLGLDLSWCSPLYATRRDRSQSSRLASPASSWVCLRGAIGLVWAFGWTGPACLCSFAPLSWSRSSAPFCVADMPCRLRRRKAVYAMPLAPRSAPRRKAVSNQYYRETHPASVRPRPLTSDGSGLPRRRPRKTAGLTGPMPAVPNRETRSVRLAQPSWAHRQLPGPHARTLRADRGLARQAFHAHTDRSWSSRSCFSPLALHVRDALCGPLSLGRAETLLAHAAALAHHPPRLSS